MRVTDSAWNVLETTIPNSISKVIKYNSFIIYMFTVVKVTLKYSGVDILILCTSLNTASKLQGKKIIPSKFIAVKINCHISKL
jgi:hypothetical protein